MPLPAATRRRLPSRSTTSGRLFALIARIRPMALVADLGRRAPVTHQGQDQVPQIRRPGPCHFLIPYLGSLDGQREIRRASLSRQRYGSLGERDSVHRVHRLLGLCGLGFQVHGGDKCRHHGRLILGEFMLVCGPGSTTFRKGAQGRATQLRAFPTSSRSSAGSSTWHSAVPLPGRSRRTGPVHILPPTPPASSLWRDGGAGPADRVFGERGVGWRAAARTDGDHGPHCGL